MSRKQKADKSLWKTASVYSLHHGYGPFQPPKDGSPIGGVTVLLMGPGDETSIEAKNHPNAMLRDVAGQLQHLWSSHESETNNNQHNRTVLVMDLRDVWQSSSHEEQGMDENRVHDDSTGDKHHHHVESGPRKKNKKKDRKPKKIPSSHPTAVPVVVERAVLRQLERLRIQNATFVASKNTCPLLLQLALGPFQEHAKFETVLDSMHLVHPILPASFVNRHLLTTTSTNVTHKSPTRPPLHVWFSSDEARSKRFSMIQHVFPHATRQVAPVTPCGLSTILSKTTTTAALENTNQQPPVYDAQWIDTQGRGCFVSILSCPINPITKQYERKSEDMTMSLVKAVKETSKVVTTETLDYRNSQEEEAIGGLVLRGNRCILVRSLTGQWKGMRLPYTMPQSAESPTDTAIRSVAELCEVDKEEMYALPGIAPIYYYGPTGRVLLYPLYASQPPPEGPLEDADMEDEDTPYDWYTFSNACKRLDDPQACAALVTMAATLQQAAHVGLMPRNQWGGVFGQEVLLAHLFRKSDTPATSPNSSISSEVEMHSQYHDGHDCDCDHEHEHHHDHGAVEHSHEHVHHNPVVNEKKLPVTVLSGFLGAGKTTLMSHILSHAQGLRVAILVNDMGDINIDAALIRNKSSSHVTVHQLEEHVVELTNGCICCTLREDLLIEIRNIAEQGCFDHLLIESSGISEPLPVAETFTFEDDDGRRLDEIASIDAMVTVVDGCTFTADLTTLETLRRRDWQADTEDERTIAHLLCDQIEFANIVILNKLDLMDPKDRWQVKKMLLEMNPTARFLESSFGAVPVEKVLGSDLFSLPEAEKHEAWLKEARIGEHTPETEEYGISSFTYKAVKPFHPERLVGMLDSWRTTCRTQQKDGSANGGTILRAKGFLWIAHSAELQGEFAFAGEQYTILAGNPWWAAIERSEWPEGLAKEIAPLWHEPHGDRQQEIVIIGQDIDRNRVTEAFDACLCSEEEHLAAKNAPTPCPEDPLYDLWRAASDMRHNHSL